MFTETLNPESFWTLSTGTVVELKMKELAINCTHEHPCLSMILDPTDCVWRDYFTKEELVEIEEYEKPVIAALPTEMKVTEQHYNSERESADKGANERTGQDDEPVIRTLASLKTRWNTIHPIVSKFCGHYQCLLNDNRSGLTVEDVILAAKDIFAEMEGHEFHYFDCWKEVLSKSQKWEVHLEVAKDEKKKKKEAKLKEAEKRKASDDEDNDNELLSKRPIGVKKAKDEEAHKRMLNEEREEGRKVLEKQIQLNRERFELMRSRNDMEVLEKDLTGLNDNVREYYEFLQEKITKRMREEKMSQASEGD
ncbi:hypothetical protein BDC45DRAFT_575898 [Circinella umbellata]|nr:hypothetical protein BDC45DRAFT_575898 [Circinella umbellata]